MRCACLGLVLLQPGAYGFVPSFAWTRSVARAPPRGGAQFRQRAIPRLLRMTEDSSSTKTTEAAASPKVTLYEEFSRYADRTSVAQEVIFEVGGQLVSTAVFLRSLWPVRWRLSTLEKQSKYQLIMMAMGAPKITSKEHFDDVVSRAAGADEHEGYEDAQGNWRIPHKLMMVQVHAGWCRVCKGLQPKLLKLIAKHPEVLCCKINKTHNEELAGKLGVRGLPMIIFYKNGKRVDHHTTANINTIEEAIRDNS